MKTVSKVLAGAALLTVGYFVGFYEMKYKMIKIMLEGALKKQEEEENTETEE